MASRNINLNQLLEQLWLDLDNLMGYKNGIIYIVIFPLMKYEPKHSPNGRHAKLFH